jgi:uncharacterized protein
MASYGAETEGMIDGFFVFDNVVHMYDMSEHNLKPRPDTHVAQDFVLRLGGISRAPQETRKYEPFARRWTTESMGRLLFEDSDTDMAMAQVVPLFDWWVDGFAPVRAQYEFAQAYPERVLFCGGVDPAYQGVSGALASMQEQAERMGARSFKFYNAHVDNKSWRCDDRELAYPLYEQALKLGIDVLQFHKGVPLGPINIEDLRPNDLQAPARDFPAIRFIIHHLGMPYFEETLSIAARFPNVYLALSGNINSCILAPRLVQEQLGRLLLHCGPEKLLWGSEAPLYGSPQLYLETFLELEIPPDLQQNYGYPQITRKHKRMILGENFSRLMKVEIPVVPPEPGNPSRQAEN